MNATIPAETRVGTLVQTILQKMSGISKWRAEFIFENFKLEGQIKGRHNFLNKARYSKMDEGTFRKNYGKAFDFVSFNLILINMYSGLERITVFDPSYVSKSGKHTPGTGMHWSGCAGHNKWGLEIGGFACVDIVANTALHMVADQTLQANDYPSLLDYYAGLVRRRSETLLKVSDYLVLDAYFSKKTFVDAVLPTDLTIISRFRVDADMLYPYLGPHPRRRGARTKYNGKFNPRHLDEAYFTCCIDETQDSNYKVYEATLYSKALKRWVRVAVKHTYNSKGKIKNHHTYFSTDTSMSGIDIFCYYKARFQIEFLYRDAKQYTGLEHCQSRSETKLDFHFNTSLTAISLAKAAHYLCIPIEERKGFSMADIKTQYFNELMIDLIIEAFPENGNEAIIISIKETLQKLGKIRA